MKANFSQILPYFSLNIPLKSLYCTFNCSNMLLWSTVIQTTQIQLPTNTHFWVIDWKPHIEVFPWRSPCIYRIWLTEVKGYKSRTAITHFLTPGTHTCTLPKITMRIIHPRWYRPTPLAHGLMALKTSYDTSTLVWGSLDVFIFRWKLLDFFLLSHVREFKLIVINVFDFSDITFLFVYPAGSWRPRCWARFVVLWFLATYILDINQSVWFQFH